MTMSVLLTISFFSFSSPNNITIANAQISDIKYRTVLSGDEEVPHVDIQAV
jgi:hypothetical protein